ncbi:MAG: inositol monophosphatase [Bacteroidetes bacterium]|nr:inositol monophosphatase [Bacteroidota bacterium]
MDLNKICSEVINVAIAAGDFIQKESESFTSDKIQYKDINNLVSYVDKEAEKLIVKHLLEILPEAGFITEENTIDKENKEGLNWIIDPLDGTSNFIHGLPHYSVSLALAQGKDVLVGVIYNITKKDVYSAIKGQGAFKNQKTLKVTQNQSLSQCLFAIGFPYFKFDNMEKYIHILESLMQKTHGLRRFGSAALDLAFVAEGFYDGFFEYNLNSWDMAAGVLLVKEAGGIITDFSGNDDYLFGGDVIAGGAVHPELLKEIKRFWYKA